MICMPDVLYHGTNSEALKKMKTKTGFINKNFWLDEKDFGPAFYTTSSLKQAKKFAIRNSKLDINHYSNPCVIQFKCKRLEIERLNNDVFLGVSFDWAQLIHEYRVKRKRDLKEIVFGPLADNRIEGVISECRREEKSIDWLYEKLIRGNDGKCIQDFDDQLVFCKEDIAKDFLTVEGTYTCTNKGGWLYEGIQDAELL
ncbi:DUF3990 domain-containing protein [Halobacillus sp. KGW1]|uniref:DUF3990 domain-containing protein n=1 Tax=Halobacillus sp. KGW1 TaxID=1793726 RepID=UPI0007813A05|nr:DUF3990 domain-containing protein [Halobacillus sp. KGW1]